MWPKLSEQVALEQQQLNKLIDTHRPLLEKCADKTPSEIELSALAAMLHSFYTGIENIFKRVAVEVDGTLPDGPFWHRDLLRAMMDHTLSRSPVLSAALGEKLRDYLEFRHVFRQAYSFQLRWDKMAELTLDCTETLHLLEHELEAFLSTNGSG